MSKENLIKLEAPEGCSSITFKGEVFEVENGILQVPFEAINDLVGAHGFSIFSGDEKLSTESGESNKKVPQKASGKKS